MKRVKVFRKVRKELSVEINNKHSSLSLSFIGCVPIFVVLFETV